MKVVDLKILTLWYGFVKYMKEDNHSHEDKWSNKGAEGRHSSEPEKVNSSSEFVIAMKFNGHLLHHLAFECDQAGKKNFGYRKL